MSTLPSTERIGSAWRSHRDGQNAEAIRAFEEVLRTSPGNVDALYGLGLANKSMGNTSAAISAFQMALSISQEALNAVQTTSQVDGHHGANDLDTSDDDRFMMLTRMLKQRLEDLGAQP